MGECYAQSMRRAFSRLPLLAVLILGLGLAAPAASTPPPVAPFQPDFGPGDALRLHTPPQHGAGAAVRNLDTGLTFATIEAALLAPTTLSGHTLQVEVPMLDEGRPVVDKSVTIQGATGSEVVRATEDTGSAGDDRAWFLVETGVDLTVRDLTFDGNGFEIFQAFRHRGTGSFEDCAFRDIQFQPSGPAFSGLAVVAFGGPVDVRRCTFEQIGRVGVLFFGVGAAGSTAEDNVYTGKGDGTFLDYAFEVSAGAQATIQRNTIFDNRGEATDGSASAGILVSTFFGPGTTAEITSNDVTDNTYGVAVGFDDSDTSLVTASFNRFFGNDLAGVISFSDTVTTDAENDWWGCNEGPGTADCDDATGLVDFDPWLILTLTADPAMVPSGGDSTLTAALTENSDGLDTSALGTVPDGIPVAFAADRGSVSPALTSTTDGTATATFTAASGPDVATVFTTVDNETVSTEIEISAQPILEVPTLGTTFLVLLILCLGLGGWTLLRLESQKELSQAGTFKI